MKLQFEALSRKNTDLATVACVHVTPVPVGSYSSSVFVMVIEKKSSFAVFLNYAPASRSFSGGLFGLFLTLLAVLCCLGNPLVF